MSPRLILPLIALVAVAAASPASAQAPEPERCPRFVADLGPMEERPIQASFVVPVQGSAGQVRLTFIGHSTFLIESPAGVTIATDYNDGVRPDVIPRIATMNRAHPTHYTFNPPPGIEYLLHGWGEDGQPARHELTVDDVWLRNVTTNIRGYSGGPHQDQNSIFVFEVAELCIAHLGHLHHTLTEDHLKALGRIDVVLVPVDGSYTLNVDDMIVVLKQIGAPLVIPMHYFGQVTLASFLARLEETYIIQMSDTPSTLLTRDTLPKQATVLVLPGY